MGIERKPGLAAVQSPEHAAGARKGGWMDGWVLHPSSLARQRDSVCSGIDALTNCGLILKERECWIAECILVGPRIMPSKGRCAVLASAPARANSAPVHVGCNHKHCQACRFIQHWYSALWAGMLPSIADMCG